MRTEHGTEGNKLRGLALNLALPKLIFGLFVVVLGVVFALDNFHLIEAKDFLRYWPVLLVALGLAKLAQGRAGQGRVGGVILLLVGSLLLAAEVLRFDIDFDDLWPLGLLLLGFWLVYTAIRRKSGSPGTSRFHSAVVSTFAFMGGNSVSSGSEEFRGGDATAVMGGVDLDLRGARLHPEGAVLDVFAMWGGIDIHVPEDWVVESQVLPVMGAYEDSTRPPAGSSGPRLLIRGMVLMGGIDVNHKPSEE